MYQNLRTGLFYLMALRANAKKIDLIKLAQSSAIRNYDRYSLHKPRRNILSRRGTIRRATLAAHRATAVELREVEYEEIRTRAWQHLDTLDYKRFI